MRQECQPVHDDLADLVAGDSAAIARHSDHLASCDDCRDARYDAAQLVKLLPSAGADHVTPTNLAERVLAMVDAPNSVSAPSAGDRAGGMRAIDLARGSMETATPAAPEAQASISQLPLATERRKVVARTKQPSRSRLWLAIGATAALAAGGAFVYSFTRGDSSGSSSTDYAGGPAGIVKTIERASKDKSGGLEVRDGKEWRVLRAADQLPAGAEIRTDERTRAAIELADGTRITLDHKTTLVFDSEDPRRSKLTSGRVVADVMTVANRPASIETPAGRVDVIGTRFALTASDKLTVVQVVRGSVKLGKEEVRAGEEGVIDGGKVAVSSAPGLAREVEWAELGGVKDTQAGAGLGALRAYKPGESRDRDWALALSNHDVRVRIVGPIARTEITETFRNDSDQTLEGVYQFPLPSDAQIDGLALDVKDAPGGFEQGAFLDKERAMKIWRGVIDKAAPKKIEIATNEIIWVEGAWRDPALLDWKRGGRFELRIFPIPPKGSRTIKISYTQVVTPRGPWRQYVYPLPHSIDGSTVADEFSVDVEVRGAQAGQIRTAGYELAPDPARADVNARSLKQTGFVPRGDLVLDYRAADGDVEARGWTFAGGFAVGPDEKLATKKNVGLDEKVLDAQRKVASDNRPTAVVALRPKLPRWREAKSRDYIVVVDSSQSMVGERYTRAAELTTRLVEQMDRRDRFTVMACDSECRSFGALRAPSVGGASEVTPWLNAQPAAGASDIVGSIRNASKAMPETADRERWIVYVGDGFSSTGFRKAGDIEKAVAQNKGVNITTVGIGTDADEAVLAAVARGGGGSYLAWVPGQSVKSAAIASLESTFGSALRDATLELPTGLADIAPTVLPTIRSGEELLVAARITGDVSGVMVLKGTVGGEKFEQRYSLKLAVSTAAGNGFVPRLWASLAIQQIERGTPGPGNDRARIVALSQGYGVMSKETSLLVLESQAMFDAFGVDRTVPAAKWTGQEALDENVANGMIAHGGKLAKNKDMADARSFDASLGADDSGAKGSFGLGGAAQPKNDMPAPAKKAPTARKPVADPARPRDRRELVEQQTRGRGGPGFGGGFAMRRTWIRVPSITAYDAVHPSIVKAIGDAERALAKAPDSRERHRSLVQALSYAGEIDRANQLAAKWLERDRLDPQALGYQADLLGRDGKRELALRMLAGVVDLDPDRVATHERMVQAYEHVGRLDQACSHRIALSSIAIKDAKLAAGAVRCLRTLSRTSDADLVMQQLADDSTRAAVDKHIVAPAPANTKRDVVVDARWDGGDDLDISIVTPDGTRVSWMGGRSDVRVVDATSTAKEQLAIESIKRGNYLIEVARSNTSSSNIVRGTLDLTVLGTKKALPFELTAGQPRKTVGRLAINMQERLETIELGGTRIGFGNIPNASARRVMLSRIPMLQGCFADVVMSNPSARGTLMLTVTVDGNGSTVTRAAGAGHLSGAARCVESQLASMHVEGTAAGSFRVAMTFAAQTTVVQ